MKGEAMDDVIDRMIAAGEVPLPRDLDARIRIYLGERFGRPELYAAPRKAVAQAIDDWIAELSECDKKRARSAVREALRRVAIEDLVADGELTAVAASELLRRG
jgi:hypothetical protein